MKKLALYLLLSFTFFSCVDETSNDQTAMDLQNFTQVTEAKSWIIDSFIDDGRDLTLNYTGYNFSFSSNQTITAQNGSFSAPGSWRIIRDNNISELDINFIVNGLLNELSEDWEIVQMTENEIRLQDRDDEFVDVLVFVLSGNETGSNQSPNAVLARELITEVTGKAFSITKVTDDGQDLTSLTANVELAFQPNNIIILRQNGQDILSGSWLISYSATAVVLDLDFPDNPLAEYVDEDWKLLEIDGADIRFEEEEDIDKDLLSIREK